MTRSDDARVSRDEKSAPAVPATQCSGQGPPCAAKEQCAGGCQSRDRTVGRPRARHACIVDHVQLVAVGAPQATGGVNAPLAVTRSAVYYVVACLLALPTWAQDEDDELAPLAPIPKAKAKAKPKTKAKKAAAKKVKARP